ncbi:amidohydrolase family protein [Sinorhizobium meliloti]|nr:amidohydrolase family protein [Sinorhizobium meliloti]MDE3776788.1 amidohydrolase family protein [Sinorhizobium meliloti]MDE3793790.1 amidohydrolase family protein [Sinorhizobium meliloti]MDE3805865.1 amidohydrolase family protein [Sinorhizobium meliloti]MQW83783.1 amidohydrolase family protein [Sinorhizobium meliloti]
MRPSVLAHSFTRRGGVYGRAERAIGRRPDVYFDTMGHDPDIIRTLTDCFGPERVLTGTDWPILAALNRDEFRGSLLRAGLNEQEARLVTGSNVRRLLGLQHERRRLSKGRQNIEPRISDPGLFATRLPLD